MAFLRQQESNSFDPNEVRALLEASRNLNPVLAQLIRGGQDRIRQINDAVEEPVAEKQSVSESVPQKPTPSTAELLKRIDALRVKQQPEPVKKEKAFIPVEPIWVELKDGEELKYRDKKTGKIYDYDPNE